MTDHDFEQQVRANLREALDRELGPDPTWAESPAARRVAEVERRRRRRWPLRALAVAALIGAGGGAALLGRLTPPPEPSPAPSLVADATASPSESAAPSASANPVAGPGGAWIPTGKMVTPRADYAAVQLLDGRVLIVGGTDGRQDDGSELNSAELYDPVSGTWSATGSMLKPRFGFPPTLLLDGRVLAGDSDGTEVYDPASGIWSSAGTVFTDGFGSAATLLRDGKVLVSGQSGAQLYDPDSGTWSATGTMITPRYNHTAVLLRDGRVLVAGGGDASPACDVPGACLPPPGELYDPDTGSWTAFEMGSASFSARFGWWASLMRDGTVLLIGDTPNLYDPTSETWSTLAGWQEPAYPKALLPDDTVLLSVEGPSCTATALYDPRTESTASASSMLQCLSELGAGPMFTLLRDGSVLAGGGSQCNSDSVCVSNGVAQLYVPSGVSLPPFDFPTPPPIEFPSPTPRPTPLPPAAGPVPPNARSWTVTVDNQSSEPATLFVADEDGDGLRLVGSATPNVVPGGATVEVTFLFPADGGWIYVNPRPGEGGALVNADDIGIPGKILIGTEGGVGWLSP